MIKTALKKPSLKNRVKVSKTSQNDQKNDKPSRYYVAKDIISS